MRARTANSAARLGQHAGKDVTAVLDHLGWIWLGHRSHLRCELDAARCGAVESSAFSNDVIRIWCTARPAVMSAQRCTRNTLELAVVDLGVGIAANLRRNPLHTELDGATAIEWSLDDGVSSLGDGRGAGRADMTSKIDRVGSARLRIASSAGEVIPDPQQLHAHRPRQECHHSRAGTWLALTLAA